MPVRQKILAAIVLLAGGALALPHASPADVLVDMHDIRPEKLYLSGFALDREQEIEIEAVGFRYRHRTGVSDISPAWILDADSREVAWTARRADSERASRRLREYRDEIRLPAGRYEVYYSSYPYPREGWRIYGFGDLISGIFRGDDDGWDRDDFDRACRDFHVTVSGEGRPLDAEEIMNAQGRAQSAALISAVQLEDEHYESFGLKLDREMALEIYAIGEADRDGCYDCCWLIDTETRKRVWTFDYRHSDRAGGAKKNRSIMDVVTLPAGSYALFCVTDDTHHFGEWNTAPPHDPFHWGVTVRAADPEMASHVSVGDYENIAAEDVIVELTRLRDSKHERGGFTLSKPMKLRVYAIGEGEDGDMFDYGWIIDADTRETVWEMEYRDTEHAGGAAKNRMIDAIIELDAGDYIACAATDGSHSYRDWNDAAPYDQNHWGLTLTTADGGRQGVTSFDELDDPSLLVQIVGVGDDEYEKERFTLESDGEVRIYALGEAENRRMYDYAWIEDDRGRVVWEMTVRNTEHAGGARKNRVFNNTVALDRGEYTVYYESDGSHSAEGWNEQPPRDRWNWGVTVKAVK
ncbi:MAG: hypothetical protein JXB04_08355 [Kiritimatiellae bacterium]|nr:hypothetical protein [Kiritimatiellia bacterium]